jgi:hypothetical protein
MIICLYCYVVLVWYIYLLLTWQIYIFSITAEEIWCNSVTNDSAAEHEW